MHNGYLKSLQINKSTMIQIIKIKKLQNFHESLTFQKEKKGKEKEKEKKEKKEKKPL